MGFRRGAKVPTNGLVLALDGATTRSNPKSGTSWYDLSSSNRTVTVPSGINTGDSLDFSNTSASISSFSQIQVNNNLTIDTWFYIGSNGTYTSCCDTLFGRYYFRFFIIGTSLYTMIGFADGSGTYTRYQHPSVTVGYGSWHHALGMRRDDRYIIWVDGQEVYNTNYGTGEYLYDYGNTWYIAAGRHPNLQIGAARVWNRGLSDKEITQMYNSQKGRFGL